MYPGVEYNCISFVCWIAVLMTEQQIRDITSREHVLSKSRFLNKILPRVYPGVLKIRVSTSIEIETRVKRASLTAVDLLFVAMARLCEM